jgi:hypothetical protein
VRREYADRLRAVGDWYLRMEGCLECAEADDFPYEVRYNKCIATRKNGKTYLHFYDGIFSSAVALGAYPNCPKSVRLMNTGKQLPFKEEVLPEFFSGESGKAEAIFLQIREIPIDDLSQEPVVLEIEW